ncbi:universal stress protein [Haliscomenobacter hydrossis]|uniref:UspA domain-containing protein n=1 Tax=Haliscomenobacter hydrossis (strain ATCC 27775 / DSM 1100 / LMG 10767 / O) TaxID=760192 RepID=F4L309_HALH1|nr:universal stress protein [Haliscomenobacter hydrossis]AEE50668.1 UspA domain-containing protein [Haliscomenobacter hydrossis DSM 1100]
MTAMKEQEVSRPASSSLEVDYLLVALEMGKADESVLHFVHFLTQTLPIKAITFVHVLPKVDLFFNDFTQNMQNLIKNYGHQDEVLDQMRNKVSSFVDAENGPRLHFSIREGNPLEEVLQEARLSGADLLLVGQRSGTGNHGILARNLVRKSVGNTLIIPEQSRAQLKTIVVPVDFSPHSVRALETAINLNRSLSEKAKIICVNIFELPAVFSYKVRHSYEALKQVMEEDRKAAFQDFINTYAKEEPNVEMELIEQGYGNVGPYLHQFCEDRHADLIVLGAKGHSKVELLLLGSVTEKLLTLNQTISTLVVK